MPKAPHPVDPPATPPVAPDVAATLAALTVPQRAVVHRLRALVRAAAPDAVESVTWNASSFALAGRHFATINTGGRTELLLVLHLEVDAQLAATVRAVIPDSGARPMFKSVDRAVAAIAEPEALDACYEQLGAIVLAWAGCVRAMLRRHGAGQHYRRFRDARWRVAIGSAEAGADELRDAVTRGWASRPTLGRASRWAAGAVPRAGRRRSGARHARRRLAPVGVVRVGARQSSTRSRSPIRPRVYGARRQSGENPRPLPRTGDRLPVPTRTCVVVWSHRRRGVRHSARGRLPPELPRQ